MGAKVLVNYGYSPVEIVVGRFLLASIIFAPLLFYRIKVGLDIFPTRKSWQYLVGLSITGVSINNLIFYFGLQQTDASTASILVSFNPLTTMIIAVIFLGESMTQRKWISVISGTIGVAFILGLSIGYGTLIGNVFITIGVTIWGASFTFSKKASNVGMSSIAITGWSEILGTLTLIPFVLNQDGFHQFSQIPQNTEVIIWFIILGIFSSFLSYILHYKAVEVFGPGKIAPSTNIIPLSGAIAAYFILGDLVSPLIVIGFILIVFAVFIVQTEVIDQKQIRTCEI